MIELLIDFLNREIKQRQHVLLFGIIPDYPTFQKLRAEYSTLEMVRDQAEKFAAGGEKDDDE